MRLRHVQTTPTPPLGGHAVTPTFSVIIPLHNVAPWLPECLASLRGQTFTQWEGLCVDDGSTDATCDVLIQDAREDARLRVIVQPPSGVSRARNRALQYTHGDAVAFLDGDDTVATWWLTEGARLLDETQADLVRFAFVSRQDGTPHHDHYTKRYHIRSTPSDIHQWGWPTFVYTGYSWCLMLRKELARQAHFPETVSIKEDCVYTLSLLPFVRCACESEAAPYCYRTRSSSALHSPCPISVPLGLLTEARQLFQLPVPPDSVKIQSVALGIFVQQAIVDWIRAPVRSEKRRFTEVQGALRRFLAEGGLSFRETFRPHWRPTAWLFLQFGYYLPMMGYAILFQYVLKHVREFSLSCRAQPSRPRSEESCASL